MNKFEVKLTKIRDTNPPRRKKYEIRRKMSGVMSKI